MQIAAVAALVQIIAEKREVRNRAENLDDEWVMVGEEEMGELETWDLQRIVKGDKTLGNVATGLDHRAGALALKICGANTSGPACEALVEDVEKILARPTAIGYETVSVTMSSHAKVVENQYPTAANRNSMLLVHENHEQIGDQ